MTQPSLPIRIMQMLRELHVRGYASLYLYSGLSPSGGHWRYAIGVIVDGEWPKNAHVVSGSVGSTGTPPWCDRLVVDASSLADAFETFYGEKLVEAKTPNAEFTRWYADTLDTLAEAQPLVFFADFPAPHAALLKAAPGYVGRY